MCHFRVQNSPFVLNKKFLVQTIIITFIYLLAIFTVQNLKKSLKQSQSYEDAPFLHPKWSICPKQFFWGKIINTILIYLLAPFLHPKWSICPKQFFWGKIINTILIYLLVPFLHPKWSICPKQFFLGKIINTILIYLLAIVQKFLKNYPADPEL